jgi:hypothetical protein
MKATMLSTFVTRTCDPQHLGPCPSGHGHGHHNSAYDLLLRSPRWPTRRVAALLFATAFAACGTRDEPHQAPGPAHTPTKAQQVVNLHAFARAYGVVRWFHPSDAGAAIDWNEFAVIGAHLVADADSGQALRERLTRLFTPIAPTVRFAAAGEPLTDALAAGAAGIDEVAWAHLGFGDSEVAASYASKRRHRVRHVAVPGATFVAVGQSVDATPYRGLRVRLRGKIRAATGGHGQLWLRVDRAAGKGFFANMDERPVRAARWTSAELVGSVDGDATRIVFGVLNDSPGTAWFDDLELAVQRDDGEWNVLAIPDPGFESPDPMSRWHQAGGLKSTPGWLVRTDHDDRAHSTASLRIDRVVQDSTEELFDDAPVPGDRVDVDLGGGLRARVPLTLPSRNGHTLGDDATAAGVELARISPALNVAGYDPLTGAADAIVVWNALQHFWPYWDAVNVDWNAELDVALAEALDDRSFDDHVATLDRITVAAPDGHAHANCPSATDDRGRLPFESGFVGGAIIVSASIDPIVRVGDRLILIDGHPAEEALADRVARTSGSAQWRRAEGLATLAAGPVGTSVAIRLERGGTTVGATVVRSSRDRLPVTQRAAIEQLDGGVMYVDLARAELPALKAAMPRLAVARAVVFDLRRRPAGGNHAILSHLLTHPDTANDWMAVAHIIRPDHAPPPAWTTFGWMLQPSEPHIRGRVAFLIGPDVISYGESIAALVERYHLGELVGAATAGTNGDIASISAPSGCHVSFTGMRVTKPGGAPLHLTGVRPTIVVSPTLAGLRAGKDEVLDRAIAVVRARR